MALGQVAALLAVLSAKLGFEDSKYKIIPRGCFSKVKTKNGKLYLYMSNNETEFNKALEALLEYVNNFSSYIYVLVGSANDDQKMPRSPKYSFSREG